MLTGFGSLGSAKTCLNSERQSVLLQASGQDGLASNSDDDDRLPHQKWQGKGTNFMKSNEHSKERAGTWNTAGLEGVALQIVKEDERNGR